MLTTKSSAVRRMKRISLSAKQIITWICVNYNLFVLGLLTLGSMSMNHSIVIISFILDVILCAVSLVLNILLFSAKHKIPVIGKIGLLCVTLCFAAFTYFAFLLPECGLPPILFS